MKSNIRHGIILRSFGISLTIISLAMLLSTLFAFYYHENTLRAFLGASLISFITGQSMVFVSRKSKIQEFGQREAFIIVTLTWFMLGCFGALPFVFSNAIPSFTDAYFETVSGFTTTGASILKDVEILPKSILFWRSMTHWLGGMGILVLVIAILPSIGYGGTKLFVAEVSGPSSNKIHPKLKKTALILWGLYLGLTLTLIILLLAGGMNFFDSVCHAFGAISTGGFSTKNSSIANYSSYIQVVITIFMFLGGTNFGIHYLFINREFKKVLSSEELKYFFLFISIVSVLVAVVLYTQHSYSDFWVALKHSFFQCVSIVTTTGYCSADYMLWPEITWFALFLLFFVTGMIGSTSGGIKFTRHLVLIKNLRGEIKRLIHPHLMVTYKFDKKTIADEVVKNFFIVFILYILVFLAGSVIMSLFVNDPKEAFSVTISCLSGVGPAFGVFGPIGNYSSLPDAGKWTLSLIMVIGRLEVIPVIILFNAIFWRR